MVMSLGRWKYQTTNEQLVEVFVGSLSGSLTTMYEPVRPVLPFNGP